jgi:hypothetical protein
MQRRARRLAERRFCPQLQLQWPSLLLLRLRLRLRLLLPQVLPMRQALQMQVSPRPRNRPTSRWRRPHRSPAARQGLLWAV